ncbi:MAG TPA: glycoside hydrolase family 15 protein [Dehalococcoidia bacterium]|nr:glycoside hydrolase family 15 protein [Dehalococcoidia bacterium]
MNESEYPPISDYGLIGDMQSCALVSKQGSIDWACFPRFDSPSVFGRLLDWQGGGYFRLAPRDVQRVTRRYLPNTNVLETTFEAPGGTALLTDFMPVTHETHRTGRPQVSQRRQIVRELRCVGGSVEFEMVCAPRFDYGSIIPHVGLTTPQLGLAHGGVDAISVQCSAEMLEQDDGFAASGTLGQGERVCVSVAYEPGQPHFLEAVDDMQVQALLDQTVAYWTNWTWGCTYHGEYREDVIRAALTLKALTYAPSGALLASATTSLPEVIGGVRNWDYRFTWIRDATFALYALSTLGFYQEGHDFKRWLEWSTLGRARDLQVMYGITGERRLTEIELNDLEGYRKSRPVRIGNGAHGQVQLDIYGEIMDSAHIYRKFGGKMDEEYWAYLQRVVNYVLDHWREPDDGIWESRGGAQHWVYSKAMCWVALDRAVKAAEELDLPADLPRWRQAREDIRAEVLQRGYNAERGYFVQAYDSTALDASVLLLPLIGFIPATDPRMRSTIEAIERELTTPEGMVYRYKDTDDGLGGEEGAFVICSFWLCDNLIFLERKDEARALFEKLRSYSNDLDLYSEELDPKTLGMLGNFPQAFTHLGLIGTAVQLESELVPSYPGTE